MAVLRSPRLWIPSEKDYPDYPNWLLETEGDIATNRKRAMLAYMGKQPVGAVVYKRHPEDPTTLQIRNISLLPDARGRHIGAFLIINTEIEAVQHDFPGCRRVTVDTKATNGAMVNFLLKAGYGIRGFEDLYGLDAGLDVVFEKPLATPANTVQ